jgi:UDP-galactopyranose mutase
MRPSDCTLLVFSPVPWSAGSQRPPQLMSRLAHRQRVIYVEVPTEADGPARLERSQESDGVLVVRLGGRVGAARWPALIRELVLEEIDTDWVAWLCTSSAMPLIDGLHPRLVVYDCIEDASDLDFGAQRLDRQLLDRADMVMAASPTLWRKLRIVHANAHCVPSSADVAQFAPERVTARFHDYLAAEQLQGHILAPRLGLADAIDERVDLELIDRIAAMRTDWHLVLAGPVMRSTALPQRDNIHWLGDQPAPRRPALVAAWDVCLMPYRSSGTAPCLLPLQALEYLAAEKPVVCTALPDVASLYGSAVRMADNAEAFIAACDEAMRETPEVRAARLARSADRVTRLSWDESARTAQRLLDEALERTQERAPRATAQAATNALKTSQVLPAGAA